MNVAWHRLRSCVVGRCWQPDLIDFDTDKDTLHRLQQILHETAEDLDHLAKVLTNFDVKVYRPSVSRPKSFLDSPPMCLGDYAIILHHKILHSLDTGSQEPYQNIFKILSSDFEILFTDNASACQAMSLFTGKHVVYTTWPEQSTEYAQRWWQQHTNIVAYRFYDDVHLDGWFCTPTEGLLLSGTDTARPSLMSSARSFLFSGYQVIDCDFVRPTEFSIHRWASSEHSWSVPKSIWSQKLQKFVDHYLTTWTGNSQETLFEVNSLVVDRHNIIMSHCSETTYQVLREHEITPHIVPWRHGLFWDSGVQCVTFALVRED
jgi:hypothetical protein